MKIIETIKSLFGNDTGQKTTELAMQNCTDHEKSPSVEQSTAPNEKNKKFGREFYRGFVVSLCRNIEQQPVIYLTSAQNVDPRETLDSYREELSQYYDERYLGFLDICVDRFERLDEGCSDDFKNGEEIAYTEYLSKDFMIAVEGLSEMHVLRILDIEDNVDPSKFDAEEAFENAKVCNWYGKNYLAIQLLNYAAEAGNTTAMFQRGCLAIENGNTNEAIKWLENAGEAGYADAFYNLGNLFYYGECRCPQDYPKALNYYVKAAQMGQPQAQCNLGACYYYGQGTQVDYDKAFKWYSKSAAQGEANAQFNEGVCYENGQGVAEDRQKAFAYFKEAAQQGHEGADARVNLYLKASKL